MTAAHLTFPLASTVRVTNLENGRQVMLRINDRGEFGAYGRIIDVSERAAELLGFKSAGIADVRVELIAQQGQAAATRN
jgi:rare lipoprotein A